MADDSAISEFASSADSHSLEQAFFKNNETCMTINLFEVTNASLAMDDDTIEKCDQKVLRHSRCREQAMD